MKDNIKPNKLIKEKSPYLLQHAYNPVNWYSWSEEALKKAKSEDKPIFLSIGYSTCHWCHVMEKECFEDEEVANLLNKNFISIKVDREERPDLDNVYMTFCQALTGHGGWPLTIIMTPDRKPFYAGTYFPKHGKYGFVGLIKLLNDINKLWKNKREYITNESDDIVNSIKNSLEINQKGELGKEIIHRAYKELEYNFDAKYGGFGFEPKFPTPHNLLFLLRYWKATKKVQALDMVEETLMALYKGGIFDHIGFGFSRYSTDIKWLVPHFEKMLYDNALLIIAYIEAFQITKNSVYKEIAKKTLDYILRVMTSEEGGFYCAEDADSEGEEGKFYTWTLEEVKTVLGEDDGKFFTEYYDITDKGNFEGKNIPNLINQNIKEIDENEQKKGKLENLRKLLFEYREKKIHPHKDDKILTSWNGLMIAAMSIAGRVLDNEGYLQVAKKTVNFIYDKLVRKDGRIWTRYRDGETAYLGYLDDYAFLCWGLLELYQATFDIDYLDKAYRLNKNMYELFWDEKNGGLFLYGNDSEQLIVRPKEIYDSAMPSGNSVALLNTLKLSRLTGNIDLNEKIEKMIKSFAKTIKANPNSYTYFLLAVLFNEIPTREIVLTGKGSMTKEMLGEINERFMPFSTVIYNQGDEKLKEMIPYITEYKGEGTKSMAYICENFTCNEPIIDIDNLIKILEKEQKL